MEKHIYQRLAFIKYLYNTAVENSRKPQPACSMALLTFHDAMESFLRLATEHFDKGKSSINFMEYWEIINEALPEGGTVSQKEPSRRLNEARVNLKHHGNMPSKRDLESYRATASNFFEANCPKIFDVDFSELSLLNLIGNEEIREHLEVGKERLDEENFEDAVQEISIAFQLLMTTVFKEKDQQHINRHSGVPLPFDSSFSSLDLLGLGSDLGGRSRGKMEYRNMRRWNKTAEYLKDIIKSISTMQEALGVVILGIDYQDYRKFQRLTPAVSKVDGEFRFGDQPDFIVEELDYQNVRFCLDFVVENVLELQGSG